MNVERATKNMSKPIPYQVVELAQNLGWEESLKRLREARPNGTGSAARIPDRKEGDVAGVCALICSLNEMLMDHSRQMFMCENPGIPQEQSHRDRLIDRLFLMLPTGERSDESGPTPEGLKHIIEEADRIRAEISAKES